MDHIDWTVVIVAVIAGVPATLAAIGTLVSIFLNLHNKKTLETTAEKLDQNTEITLSTSSKVDSQRKETIIAAEKVAVKVNESSTRTNEQFGDLKKQLNGAMDDRIRAVVNEVVNEAVGKLHERLDTHTVSDENNMKEIREAIERIAKAMVQPKMG